MHRCVFDDKKLGKNNFVVDTFMRFMWKLFRFQPLFIYFFLGGWGGGATHRESFSTRNSIAIINHLSFNALNYFIIVTQLYLCLYFSILCSDLENSRMCLWNKIPIPPFGARSNVYHPCKCYKRINLK